MTLPIRVFHVETSDGPKDYVSCLTEERVLATGLPAEAIIGVLTRPLSGSEPITPAVFARNHAFVEFMQKVIGQRGPDLESLRAEARSQGDGWLYVVDQRARTPGGQVPPEDIVGAFEVRSSQVVPGSYRPNPKHALLTANGFLQLGSELERCLLGELTALAPSQAVTS